VLYWLLWGVAHILARILYRVSYSGGQNIPRKGPVLVCANHLSWWDPVILAAATRRRIYFMGKVDLWDNRVFGLLLSGVGAFPVKRGEPDRKSLRRALELLEQGRAVGIFPEGTRSKTGTFKRGEPGIGLLVLRTGAQVVPAHFTGPYRFRGPVRLVIGRPVDVSRAGAEGVAAHDKRQAVADAVMAEIAALGGRTDEYGSLRGSHGQACLGS